MTGPIRIVQITDLHLLEDPEGRLADVPTWSTLEGVLTDLEGPGRDFELMVVTGDIAQDERPPTYAALAERLRPWSGRCRLVPGNHDTPRALSDAFGGNDLPMEDKHGFSIRLGGWRIVGLDSHEPGAVWGQLGEEQLAWLVGELEADRGAPSAIFVHHPPVPIGRPWIDDIGLRDGEALRAAIEAFDQVRVVACGHVHHGFERRLGGILYCTAPSTAFQFEGRDGPVRSVVQPPGYRWMDLWPDRVETGVRYLPAVDHPPRPS